MKTETIPFREFMSGSHHTRKKTSPNKSIYSIFPVITPGSLFPIHDTGFALFLIGGATIVGSAFFQHLTAKSGSTAISETISAVSGLAFPIIVYGAIFWFFFTL